MYKYVDVKFSKSDISDRPSVIDDTILIMKFDGWDISHVEDFCGNKRIFFKKLK
jgi:hypothetical protein